VLKGHNHSVFSVVISKKISSLFHKRKQTIRTCASVFGKESVNKLIQNARYLVSRDSFRNNSARTWSLQT